MGSCQSATPKKENEAPLPPPPAKSALKSPTQQASMSDEENEKEAAATKLQALARGKQERKRARDQETERKRRTSIASGAGNAMNALLMRFPIVRKSFQALFTPFQQNKSAGSTVKNMVIDKASLSATFALVAKKELSIEDLEEMFAKVQVKVEPKIKFKEFLIGTHMYFVDLITTDVEMLEIQKGFQIIRDTFVMIDEDGGGEITKSELKTTLCGSGGGDAALLDARFQELDLNDDKEVDVNEFLWAMGTWSGFTGEE